jgi:CII-binding regulator of phage lambda lysogenization HflD
MLQAEISGTKKIYTTKKITGVGEQPTLMQNIQVHTIEAQALSSIKSMSHDVQTLSAFKHVAYANSVFMHAVHQLYIDIIAPLRKN